MKKHLLFYALVLGSATFACKTNPPMATACIDPSKIDKERACTMQYDPVCGCDGKTYGNACVAESAGVTSFTKGECAAKSTNN